MKRFKNILCVVEPGAACVPALDRAVTLAENNHAALTVVAVVKHVTEDFGNLEVGLKTADLQAALVCAEQQEMAAQLEPYQARLDIHTEILIGTPFLEVIHQVIRRHHDLVIKLPENQDWLDRLLGSDDMHLLRKCPCPVWIIKPQAPKAYRRILAAVDVSDACPPKELAARHALNLHVLEMACSQAIAEFTELHIVHVWDALGESVMRGAMMSTSEEQISAYVEQVRIHHADRLDKLLHELTGQLGKEALDYLKPRSYLVKGSARREIPILAKRIEADLLVMGTVARTGLPGFVMGNTAETILNQIDCSVLAVKPPGFVTPVTLMD